MNKKRRFSDVWQPGEYLLSPYDSMQALIDIGYEETIIAEFKAIADVDEAIYKMINSTKD